MNAGTIVASRFTIERELGRGGMGTVYLARDEKFGARVALKVAAASGVSFDEFRERFRREAHIGHLLGRAEGFVRALDWGELDPARLYLAMDLVEGARPLDLTSGSLPERLGRLLAAAKLVAAAHAKGVVHRDLKPQNFLVGSDGRVHLSDFGLAKAQAAPDGATAPVVTRSGLGMGTPAFMPPEQFEDARTADERSDVYALGVMLFLALTGRLPFEGSPTAIQKRQLRVQEGLEAPPRAGALVAGLPPALESVCARALELDPAKRLASASELVRALEGAPAEAAVTTPVAPPAAPSAPRKPARRWIAVVGVGCLLAFLVAASLPFLLVAMPLGTHAYFGSLDFDTVESGLLVAGRVRPSSVYTVSAVVDGKKVNEIGTDSSGAFHLVVRLEGGEKVLTLHADGADGHCEAVHRLEDAAPAPIKRALKGRITVSDATAQRLARAHVPVEAGRLANVVVEVFPGAVGSYSADPVVWDGNDLSPGVRVVRPGDSFLLKNETGEQASFVLHFEHEEQRLDIAAHSSRAIKLDRPGVASIKDPKGARSYIFLTKDRWHDVTGNAGTFSIPGAPAVGTVRLYLWHPSFKKTFETTVNASSDVTIELGEDAFLLD